jgi:CheY-like chemotaxis protein
MLAPITLTAHRREGFLRVEVHDPQLFIDAFTAEDLFSANMLSNDSLLFSHSSSFGQGLMAVKRSLRSVGGDCDWEWHETSGVVFSIELPCLFDVDETTAEVGAAPEAAPAAPVSHTPSPFRRVAIPALAGRKVLLADTNPLHRHVLREELHWQGVERVDEARDGQHAIQLMQQNTYDVAILDLVLPVLNGLECLKELEHAKAAGSHVPIVFGMSNAAEREDIALAFQHGMHAFFNKPTDVEDMCAVICRVFERTQPQAADAPACPEVVVSDTSSTSHPGLASAARPRSARRPRSAIRRLMQLGRGLRKLFGNLPSLLRRGSTDTDAASVKPEKSKCLTLCRAL